MISQQSLHMHTYTGCSGFHYKEWKGRFYPEGMPQKGWLSYYAQHFDTLELNSTFYKFPTEKGLAKWYVDTPDDFSFVVKASKLFTHYYRMKNVQEELQRFYTITSEALRQKLRCYLFQFPATVKYSEEMLEAILTRCDSPLLHAFEFRHISWWEAEAWKPLQQAGHIFCNISLPDFPDMFVPDERHTYLRFHGKPELYKSAYGAEGLQWWLMQLEAQPSMMALALFNNTWYADAVDDAKFFRDSLAGV